MTEMKAIQESLSGKVGDRYAIVSKLGRGAFSEVYKARDKVLDREVAIKRIRLDTLPGSPERDEARQRFIREAKVVAKLKHPNVVTIYDFVEAPGMSFIIMELVEGFTLEEVRKRNKRFSLEETIGILSQVADALDYAHRNEVIHRDIKPANIMIDTSGCVKVTDFGIAKSGASSNVTTAGMILGTPNYMSPEQARGEDPLDGRSDLFSLGCVLYECLAGEKPFHAENPVATLMRIVNGNIPVLDHQSLGVHANIKLVLDRALAHNPDRRYRTGAEMIAALKALSPIESEVALRETVVLPARPVVTRRNSGTEPQFDETFLGDLGATPLVEVIRGVNESGRTGILHVENKGVKKRIYFKRGSIVFANSDLIDDRLDEHLKRTGAFDESVIALASQIMVQSGNRLGKTLIELGYLDTETMEAKVLQQVEAIIDSLFDWKSGGYRFELLDDPVEEDITVKISTADTILKGVRHLESLERIREGLGRLDRVLHHSANALVLLPQVSLTPEEGYVLSRIDGLTSVSDTVAISPLSDEETLRCIYGLFAAGMVALKENPAANPTTETQRTRAGENTGVRCGDPPDEADQHSETSSGRRRGKMETRRETTTEDSSAITASNESSTSSFPDERAETLYLLGSSSYRGGGYFNAIQYLEEAIRLCPNQSKYHALLARALAKNPYWWKESQEHFRRAHEIGRLRSVPPGRQEESDEPLDLAAHWHEPKAKIPESDTKKI